MKFISVIIPYYQKKKFLGKAINSVLRQSYKRFEIIVVYDDPDKNYLKFLISKYKKNKNVKFVINKKNIGAGLSRNIGIKKSRGYYIAFIDSDDIWEKNKLKDQVSFMKKKNIDISHTSYKIIDKNSQIIGRRTARKKLSYMSLLKSCDIGLSTVMIKKKVIFNKFKFPDLKTKEDYVLWLTLSKKRYIFHGLNKYLVRWRKLDNSLSSSIIQKIKDGYMVYYKYMDYNFVFSFFCLFRLSLNYLIKNK